ncbi:MAG: DNA-processing protein DprA [Chloroflexota bacterium]|nr:DNA-processing protein DprA [Chloroflexota bacterium]
MFDAPSRYYPSDSLSLDELAYWVAFTRILGIGPIRFKMLLDYFHEDVSAAWKADSKELARAGLDQKISESFIKQRASSNPQQELEKLARLKVQVITIKDKEYPPLLKEIYNAPSVLYVAGTLKKEEDQFAIGVVGTRKVSTYGRQVTERFARELAQGHVTVVSGLAHGIDTIAHTTALDAGGRTIAIMASGLDIIYPLENVGLARRIVESGQGALVTEFPLGVKPDSRNFPARNRIISGLSQGILVTEAPKQSGALITANFALEHGREVFAVPNGIFAAGSVGVNKLIQDGAHLVTDVQDILMALNLFMIPEHIEMQTVLPENEEEGILLPLLSHDPCHIDELIRASELPTMTVTSTLMMMESNAKLCFKKPVSVPGNASCPPFSACLINQAA